MKQEDEAKRLFSQANEKYAFVERFAPTDYVWVYIHHGGMLLQYAQNESEIKSEHLYNRACEKFSHVESIKPGIAAYNLACAHAMQEHNKQCEYWLNRSKDAGTLPSLDYISDDYQLDSVRDSQWFQDFLQSLPPT